MNRLVDQILYYFLRIGIKLYPVGGCLRDMIMNVQPKDLDFTTPHSPAEIEYRLTDEVLPWFVKIFQINKEHLTLTVVYKEKDGTTHELEITQFRLDKECDGRHAKPIATKSLEEDLARRDFTINAIAYDGETNDLVDPFNGRADIDNGVLKCVGDPMTRFKEDELRVLRLFRFEARLGFTIDPDTLSAAMECGVGDHISTERIRDEISSTFNVPDADCGLFLDRLKQSGVLKRCLPMLWAKDKHGDEVFCDQMMQIPTWHKEGDVWTHIKMVVQAATGVWGRWIALLHDIAKPCTATWDYLGKGDEWYSFPKHDHVGAEMIPGICKDLRLEKQLAKIAVICTRWHMDIYKFCANVGKEDGGKVIDGPRKARVREVQASFDKAGVSLSYMKDLALADHMGRPASPGVDAFWTPLPQEQVKRALSGHDVMAADNSVKPGLELKEMLDAAYKHQIATGVTDTIELLSVALNYREEK